MAERKFEFSDAKSHKFWIIERQGTDVITRYGRIGTDGQSTTKSQASEEAAQKLHDKLVNEKLKKGYVEVAGGKGKAKGKAKSGAGAAAGQLLSANLFCTTRDVEDMGDMTTFIGKRVADFQSVKSIKKGDKHVYRVRSGWDDEPGTFEKRLAEFLDSDAAPPARRW